MRDNYIREQGYKILRFSDKEIFKNLTGVIERIYGDLICNPPVSPFRKGGVSVVIRKGGVKESPFKEKGIKN